MTLPLLRERLLPTARGILRLFSDPHLYTKENLYLDKMPTIYYTSK